MEFNSKSHGGGHLPDWNGSPPVGPTHYLHYRGRTDCIRENCEGQLTQVQALVNSLEFSLPGDPEDG
jgi:hypothetical protein